VTLHLVRLPVDLRALAAFAVANSASDDDGGYALHLALRQRFGEAGPQPFRLFAEHRAGPHLLAYTTDAEALASIAGLPAVDALLGDLFRVPPTTQAMPADWRTGQRLGFEVRARPVVRFGGRVRAARAERPGAWLNRGGKAAQEMDAFLAACERAGEGIPVDRETVYRDWLTQRLAAAAEVESADLRLFRRVRTRRSTHGKRGSPRVEGPEAVIGGTLMVGDPALFAAMLTRGVGRHAAFGYGMLLLSPPGRAG
jgi:CRISPR system Cascade subunit CasE